MAIIKIINTVSGAEYDETIWPKPAKQFLPSWWKDIPNLSDGEPTIKMCPSFPDYFSQGVIIPIWKDFTLQKLGDNFTTIEHHRSIYSDWEIHPRSQFLDHFRAGVGGRPVTHTIKAVCPWEIITPPGYSVMQLPVFYEFNQDFTVMPGIVDTDIHHEIHQQIMLHTDSDQLEFTKGTPLVAYIPFKREKYQFEVLAAAGEEESSILNKANNKLAEYKAKYDQAYRRIQRERDKD